MCRLWKVVRRMSRKNGAERIAGIAQHAKALNSIAKAFIQGGWQAAAVQSVKHYWPQILAIVLIILLLPVIVFCCLPAMLFGFGSSTDTDTEVASLNMQAETVSAYYERYDEYCAARVEEIESSVKSGSAGSGEEHQAEESASVYYKTTISGSAMEKNWFIALHSVSAGNDLNAMSEDSVLDMVEKCIVYTIEEPSENTEGNNDDTKILNIQYLTPQEYMDVYGYSDFDKNWAQLMYQTLQEESASG